MTNAERALDVVRRGGAARPFVVAQLGQSLDGRIALPSGESRYINGPAALDHLHRLRAAVDAVIVGIGAVIADNPQLTVRRVEGRNPARIIVDPNGRLPAPCRCLEENGAPVFVIRRRSCPHSRARASEPDLMSMETGAGFPVKRSYMRWRNVDSGDSSWKAAPIRCHGFSKKASLIGCIS